MLRHIEWYLVTGISNDRSASIVRVSISHCFSLLLRNVGLPLTSEHGVEASWNMMVHAQKTDFVFRRNGRVHLNRRGRQFSRLLAAEVCASAVVMLDTPCSEVVWRVLATHCIRQFPLHFPYRASPCAITFQLKSITASGSNLQQRSCQNVEFRTP